MKMLVQMMTVLLLVLTSRLLSAEEKNAATEPTEDEEQRDPSGRHQFINFDWGRPLGPNDLDDEEFPVVDIGEGSDSRFYFDDDADRRFSSARRYFGKKSGERHARRSIFVS